MAELGFKVYLPVAKASIFHHAMVPTHFNALVGSEGTMLRIFVLWYSVLLECFIHDSAPIQILSTEPQLSFYPLTKTAAFSLLSKFLQHYGWYHKM